MDGPKKLNCAILPIGSQNIKYAIMDDVRLSRSKA
jgi:hypothetical protein